MDSWQELTEKLPEESRDELAMAILEALESDHWYRVDVEIRFNRIHAVNITKRVTMMKVPNRTNVASKS